MSQLEKWVAAVMVGAAVLGTVWYIALELQTKSAGNIGWSLIAVIWFVVLRRLVHLWARGKRKGDD